MQTTTPAAPRLPPGFDSGASDSDGISDIALPTLVGQTVAGAAVMVYDSDGVSVLGSGVADANGFYNIVLSQVLGEGGHLITVTAAAPGQTVSKHSTALPLTIDTMAPDMPAAPILPAAYDTGFSAADGVTSKKVLQLIGLAEPGSTVQLFNMGAAAPLASAVAGDDGSYTLTTAALADSSYNFIVTATDVAGNVSKPSAATAVTIDSVAPNAPAAPTLSPGSDTGGLRSDGLTNDNAPVVVGTAEANATVELFDGTAMVGKATADGTGAYAITSDALADGAHALSVKAVDAAGNVGAASAPLNIVVDTAAPTGTSAPAVTELGAGSVPFAVHFSASVSGVTAADFTLVTTGTVSGSVQSVTGSGADYTVTVSGLDGQGNVGLALVAGSITDLAGNAATLKESDTHPVSGTTQPITTEVSVTPSGLLGTGTDASASASGRLVAFTTLTGSLTSGPATDGLANVVVRDTLVGTTTLVSVDLDGAAANGASGGASMSADGTEIAFASEATNLVDGGTTPGETNVYVAKLTEGASGPQLQSITLVSAGNGQEGEGVNDDGSQAFDAPILSADGSTVAFDSTQALVSGAENGVENVYAENVATGAITLVSGGTGTDEYGDIQVLDPVDGEYFTQLVPVSDKAADTGGDFNSDVTSVSADGKLIAYESLATDLGGAPVTVFSEVAVPYRGYVYNVATDETTNIDGTTNVDPSATADPGNINTFDPVLSGDGSKVFYVVHSVSGVDQVQQLYQYIFATGVTTPVSVQSAANNFEVYDFGASASKGGSLLLFQDNPGLYTDQAQYQATLDYVATGTTTALSAGYAETLTSAGNAYFFSEEPNGLGSDQLYETDLGVSVGIDPIDGDDAVDASVLGKAASGGGLAVSGTTNAPRGATVAVQLFGASAATNTLNSPAVLGTVDGLGHWSATVPTALLQSADGNYALVVQVGTPAGNSFFSVRDFIVDTKAPAAPDAPKLDAGADTSLANDGSATNQNTPPLTGTAEPGATVTLYDSLAGTSPVVVGTTTADGDGVYAVTPDQKLDDGKHALDVTATDAAGNVSAASADLSITVDTVAPAPPTLALSPGSDTGSSDSDGITSNAGPTVTGTGEAGTQITLYDTDGVTMLGTTTVKANETWSLDSSNLSDGAHTLTATDTDKAGNVSAASDPLSLVIDTTAPFAPTISSIAGVMVGGKLAPLVDVMGNAAPGTTVTLQFDGGTDVLGTSAATEDGEYSIDSDPLPSGDHMLSVISTDLAGNASQPSLQDAVSITASAVTPPGAPNTTPTLLSQLTDGPIAGATVFADSNGNGVRDADEGSAVTGTDGYVMLPDTGGELVASGGTDTTTGISPTLTFTAPAHSTIIDPLTTLLDAYAALTGADPLSVQPKLLAALGLPASIDLTTLDPNAALLAGNALPEVLGAKIVNALTDFQAYLASNGITDSDGFAAGFTAIAKAIAALPAGQVLDLDGGSSLEAIFESAAGPAGPLDTPIGGNASAATTVAAFGNEALSADLQTGGIGLAAAIVANETVYQGAAATALRGVGTSAANGAQVINLYDTDQPLYAALENNAGLVDGPPTIADDTGRSDADQIIDIETPTFTGAALPGTNVALFLAGTDDGTSVVAGTVIGTGTADAAGHYSIIPVSLDTYRPNGNSLSVDAIYQVGAVGSSPSQGITFTVGEALEAPGATPLTGIDVDPLSPEAPTITDATVAAAPDDDAGHAALYIYGKLPYAVPFVEQGATITIYADGNLKPIATGSDLVYGNAPDGTSQAYFGLTTTALTLGSHTLTVTATLAGGTIVPGTASYAVTVAAPPISDGIAAASGRLAGARVYYGTQNLQVVSDTEQLVPATLQDAEPVDTVEAATDGDGGYAIAEGPADTRDLLFATGGIDTLTGLPLGGYLAQTESDSGSSYTDNQGAGTLLAPLGSTAISPLTTIEALLGGNPAAAATLAAFGLPANLDLTTLDPIAAAQSGDVRPFLVDAELLDTVTMLTPFVGFGFGALAAAVAKTGTLNLDSAASITAALTAAYPYGISNGKAFLGLASYAALAAIIAASNQAMDSHATAAVSLADTLSYTLAAETLAQEGETAALQAQVVAALSDGSTGYTVDLTSITAADTGASLDTAIQAVRAAAAQATGFVAAGALTTAASSVDFTLSFGTAISGLTAADFAVVTTGDLTDVHVTSLAAIAGSQGRDYDVTVATGAGSGSLAVTFTPGTSLVAGAFSAASNALLEPAKPINEAIGGPIGLVGGDLNGDGLPDAVLVNDDDYSKGLTVLLNQGNGTFVAQAPIVPGGLIVTAAAIGDFNGDGKPDIITVEGGELFGAPELQVALLPGNGDGTFGSAIVTDTGIATTDENDVVARQDHDIAVGDFNHDGRLDIAIAGSGSEVGYYGDTSGDTVDILLGNGDGTFRAGLNLDTQTDGYENDHVNSVATADLNGDGNLDLVAVNAAQSAVDLYLGNGDGTFRDAPSLILPNNTDPQMAAIGDLNGDGIPDIVVLNDGGSINVFLGQGDGSFAALAAANLPAAAPDQTALPGSFALADMNGDGRLDLVVDSDSGTEVLDGNGDGTFSPGYSTSDAGDGSYEGYVGPLAVADVNADGRPDVLIPGYDDAAEDGFGTQIGLNVLLNTPQTVLGSTSQSITIDRPTLAAPVLSKASGGGSFTQAGNAYTLDLGTLAFGASTTAVFALANAAAAPADSFDGTFSTPVGGGFTVAGASLPQAVAAGYSYGGLSFSVDAGTPGTHTETITFAPRDATAVPASVTAPDPDGGAVSPAAAAVSNPVAAELPAITLTVTDNVMPCFHAGTQIATPCGAVAVERLRVGDLVSTASGGARPIAWIGTRRLDCRRHPRPDLVHPVRIRAGAFGPRQPSRNLLLSPDHAIFAEAVLIPVKQLVNGVSVTVAPRRWVEYFHIELDRHDVILAEGLPVESYLDTGDRDRFASGACVVLHPDFANHVREAEGCAPLHLVGPVVERVHAALVRRAASARAPAAARPPAAAGVVKPTRSRAS